MRTVRSLLLVQLIGNRHVSLSADNARIFNTDIKFLHARPVIEPSDDKRGSLGRPANLAGDWRNASFCGQLAVIDQTCHAGRDTEYGQTSEATRIWDFFLAAGSIQT